MDKKSSAYFSHLFYNKANVNEGAAFIVMLGVILINTILAILVVVLGIVIKSRM